MNADLWQKPGLFRRLGGAVLASVDSLSWGDNGGVPT